MSKNTTPSLAHVVYRTRKYEQMLAWYKEMFHARVQHQNPALAQPSDMSCRAVKEHQDHSLRASALAD